LELADPVEKIRDSNQRSAVNRRATADGRILLAEDNLDMRRYILRLLVADGFTVEAVADGEAALRAVRSHRPNLVLSDVMMPGMDGFALLAAIRADPELRGTPVILISARAGEEARVEGFEADADDYLIKPFSARELLARVRSNLRTSQMRRDAEALRQASEARLRIALDAASAIGAWDWDIKKNRVYVDARFARMFSVDPERAAAGVPLSDFMPGIHPEDRDRVAVAIQHAIDRNQDYQAEFRVVQPDHSVVWVLARGHPYYDANGVPDHFPGVVIDITDRIKAEQQRMLLVNELNHRVKNTLATVQSLAAQSMRSTDNPAEARAMFESRLAALSRAHDLLTAESWQGASLQDIADRALEPFQTPDRRLITLGPQVRLSPKQALGFAMVIHELATNALKYGALSNDAGRVSITWFIERDAPDAVLNFTWVEEGGPLVVAPRQVGFGSRLIQRGLSSDLGGDATIEFRPAGVVAVVRSPIEPTTLGLAAASEN
jgi:PAS domain S-box-containing protein